MMTINDYKHFAPYPTEINLEWTSRKFVKGLGRGRYITNIAIIGARMYRGICNCKTHLYKKKLILKMRKRKNVHLMWHCFCIKN